MSKPSLLQERVKQQCAELLMAIQMAPQVTTAELVARTGMSHSVVRKRLAVLIGEGKITVNRDLQRSVSATRSGLSLEERISTIERLLQKHLA